MRAPFACANTAPLPQLAPATVRFRALQPNQRRWPRPLQRPQPHAWGRASLPGNYAISASLWTVSGADDRSPCCEQINLPRVDPRIQHPPRKQEEQPYTRTIPLLPSLARPTGDSKGFVGVCSIPCSHSNTASPPRNIPVESDLGGAPSCKHLGNLVSLVVCDLEHNPAVWNNL